MNRVLSAWPLKNLGSETTQCEEHTAHDRQHWKVALCHSAAVHKPVIRQHRGGHVPVRRVVCAVTLTPSKRNDQPRRCQNRTRTGAPLAERISNLSDDGSDLLRGSQGARIQIPLTHSCRSVSRGQHSEGGSTDGRRAASKKRKLLRVRTWRR